MINVKKGDSVYKVSKGSYEIYYKPLGFEIVEEKKIETKKEVKQKVGDNNDNLRNRK